MTDLLLGAREQAAVRAVIASDPVPGAALPAECALPHLDRLVDCDALGLAVVDATGSAVEEAALPRDGAARRCCSARAPRWPLGLRQRDRAPRRTGPRTGRGVAVLSLGVRNGPDHVVTLWLVRRSSDFSEHDRALLALVTPALERLLRAHRTRPSPLTHRPGTPSARTTWRPGCPTPRSPHGSSSRRAPCASTSRTPIAVGRHEPAGRDSRDGARADTEHRPSAEGGARVSRREPRRRRPWPRPAPAPGGRGRGSLRVDLVDVLGATRPGREPGRLGDHLQPADRCSVAGRLGQLGGDRLTGQGLGGHVVGGQAGEPRLLLRVAPRRCGRRPVRRAARRASGSAGRGPSRCWPGSPTPAAPAGCRPCRWSTPTRRGAGTRRPPTPRRRTAPTRRAVRDEPLEPDRHLDEPAPEVAATRSIIELDTSVLPMKPSSRHRGRCRRRGTGSPRRGSGWGSSARHPG